MKKHFDVESRGKKAVLRAVDGVSLELPRGETLGIVGESGCGKSTLARLIVGLTKPTEGRILAHGGDIWAAGKEGRARRAHFQMVFQNPAGSMNPRRTVGASVAEPLQAKGVRRTDAAVAEMMARVGLNPALAVRRPHQLSGGQQQRASIARALIASPTLVVHDESIASLDISLQAQILNLLLDLQRDLGTSYLFISHDLAAVQTISHRIAVMYLGEVVEATTAEEFARQPRHPYSLSLRSATLLPDPERERNRPNVLLQGDVPSPLNPPAACRFHTRCPLATDRCRSEKPALRDIGGNHLVSCHFPEAAAALGGAPAADVAESLRCGN
ncbi:oligopeptide/dipeptide ABC transporter ATP-binding protein [Pelagibius sp. CAU 1746]|uniref:ABC transporter ATP-binding protein n=1 Tax=Pelagibius sp. CAU 1746 TaxID=3140370 RepID=UPI00325B756C